MKSSKRFLALLLVTAMLSSMFVSLAPLTAVAYDNTKTFTVTGFDTTPPEKAHSDVYVYPNTTSSARVIKASDYCFRYSKLFIFNASGKLIEAGENIYPNSDTVTGSPQLTVSVPAGGFMVAFGANHSDLMACYNAAMEGAMLYNATMSVIYDVKGSYNKSTSKLTVEYDNPKAASASAKKFMFVGNSTTYFNGIPIKFKGIAQAAGVEIDVTYCTKGSSYLYQYADATTDCGTKFRNLLNTKSFDYVVLQDAGKAVYSQSKPAMDTLMPLIAANGAKAVLYKRYASETSSEDRLAHAKIHHENYTQLAEDFGIDMVAPVADAFIISELKYPEINLYADDDAHHSKEGSYLAALVWAITYLGIDISNNSYTADLPEATVTALKECAKLACEVGYFEAPKTATYENLVLGNEYTISVAPPTGAPDTDNKELTDGVVAKDNDMTSPYYSDSRWVGISFSQTVKEVEVVMPLGNGFTVSELYKVTVNAGTTLVTGGCHEPHFTVYYSADGKNYHKFGTHASVDAADAIAMNFTVSSSTPVRATHIKLVFSPYSGTVCRVSEISAYGYRTNLTRVNAGNSYTISAEPPTGNPGDSGNELTDGEIVRSNDIASTKYNDERWVGLSFNHTDVRSIDVVMPLGDGKTPVNLCEVVVNFGTDAIGAGVTEPSIIVYASTDGEKFTEFGRYDRVSTTTEYAFDAIIEGIPVKATHIKVNFTIITGRTVCRVGEIAAYGYVPRVENITKGNDYTISLTPATECPDENNATLTDGIVVLDEDITSPTYADERWVGLTLTKSIRTADIVIPLGDGKGAITLQRVDFNIGSDKIGSGVFEPNITVYYSTDGTNFKEFGNYTRTGNTETYALNGSVSGTPVSATHIKLTLTHPDKNVLRISEVAAYGYVPYDENLTHGNSYTTSITPSTECPDENNATLTDGVVVLDEDISSPTYADTRWVGLNLTKAIRTADIVIPLGDGKGASVLNRVDFNIGSDKIGSGVYEPSITVYYSTDGTNFKEFGKYTRTGNTETYALNGSVSGTPVSATHIKLTLTHPDKNVLRISEVAAYGEPHQHSASATVWATDKDNHWNECSCGKQYNLKPHDSGAWVTVKEADVDVEGKKELRCTECAYVLKTETIPATHKYSEDWSNDKDNHWHECACGEKADVAEHTNASWVVVTPAGLHKEGTQEFRCGVCGYAISTSKIDAEHDFTNGYQGDAIGHWQTCACGEEDEIVKAHDDGAWFTVKEADIDVEGKKELRCTVCQYVLKTETIPAKHSFGKEWKNDKDNHWHECACGEKSDLAPHTAGDWEVVTPATVEKAGEQVKKCTVCSYVLETKEIPKLEPEHTHSAVGGWASDKDYHWNECSCGEDLNKAAHTAGDWVVVTPATTEKAGEQVKKCSVCEYVLETKEIPKLPEEHKHSAVGDWKHDETGHWKECSCGEKLDFAPHTEENCDCGYEAEIEDDYMLGDVNDSKEIDSMDYVLVKRAYFGTFEFDEEQFKRGDVNKSGDIDSMDYVLIKRAYFGTFSFE